jgi:hypothetical protein
MLAARSYAEDKVPFQDKGRSRYGVDCIGILVCAALEGCEIQIEFSPPTYPARPTTDLLTGQLKKHLVLIRPWSRLQVGDVVRFNRKNITHVGIVGDKYKPFSVIHVTRPSGCVEVRLDMSEVHSIYRYPKWLN